MMALSAQVPVQETIRQLHPADAVVVGITSHVFGFSLVETRR